MTSYSENWQHLNSILCGYSTGNNTPSDICSYEEQRYAKALSIFLVNAKLATPVLNRTTVEAILAGTSQWPCSTDEPFAGTEIQLSHFEKLGVISFYAGWCKTHRNRARDLNTVEPSLVQLIKAVDHLEDIAHGRNGCVQPHYASSEATIRQLLYAEFGNNLSAEQLLPELELKDGVFSLPPSNRSFSSIVSTQLWLTLRSIYSPEQAFSNWMQCFCVNCDWVMPVTFDTSNYEERNEFNTQLLNFLSEDPALAMDVDFVIKQSLNEEFFSHYIRPVKLHQTIVIDEKGCQSRQTTEEELPAPTLDTLEHVYPDERLDLLSELECIAKLQHSRMYTHSNISYSWLIHSAIDSCIRIDSQYIHSSDFVENVMKLADSRPILKYILFIILPTYGKSNYMLWLLANSATSDVALYYLADKNFERSQTNVNFYAQNLQAGYQKLVCQEYIRTVGKEPDFVDRFLMVFDHFGGQCDFTTSDFSENYKYRFLINLLEALDHQHVVQLAQSFSDQQIRTEKSRFDQLRKHYKYLLGFWLNERLETSGIDPTGQICRALRESIHRFYSCEFDASLKGVYSLDANVFFSTLPWRKLIGEMGSASFLTLSDGCFEWRQELAYDRPHPFNAASTLRQYLQVLMCLGKPRSNTDPLHSVTTRVLEIVRTCAFGPREKFVHLFAEQPTQTQYDLWQQFCSYSNAFRDDLYEDFLNRCVNFIPLDQLFVLQNRCTIIARASKLHEAIDIRLCSTENDLGLSSLEQAFTAACDSGRTETAIRLLQTAKEILAQERFANSDHPEIIRVRKIWESYEYKWQLLVMYESNKSNLKDFQSLAHKISIPHERNASMYSPYLGHYQECEYFRRQLVAMACIDIEPTKSIRIMEQLYRETKRDHHGYSLFYAHLKLYAVDQDKTRLEHALAFFLNCVADIEPEKMNDTWIANILDAYRVINSSEIDNFWMRLSDEQHTQLKILKPYCRALITRGDSFVAKNILKRYQVINHSTPEDLGIDDLISDLTKEEDEQLSMRDMVQFLNETSQRSTLQLQKHYSQIRSKDFHSYIDIVRPDTQPHEYLRDAVLEIAKELTLRKRNLQIECMENGRVCYRLMLEDWINDWFTSLFDQRMSEARIGFRDQKRGGHSASGKNPGEIDGFITSNDNSRIAIFEAFRLTSVDTTVIQQHLNKIMGYNPESLSPVFIVGYCDALNFSNLVAGYKSYVQSIEYTGHTLGPVLLNEIKDFEETDHIWLGTEIRQRNLKDIVFYHLLINLHFSSS